MTQALARRETAAIMPVGQFTREQIELIKDVICAGSTDDELRMFVQVSELTGLNPFARQIFAVKRYDSQKRREVMNIQVSVDGLRLTAERSGLYRGQVGPEWCGKDGVWRDIWLEDTPPAAARVGVLKAGYDGPVYGKAVWKSYAQTKNDGSLTQMWARMPDVMLAKCAESLALRKAFPMECSGLYSRDEMAQAEADTTAEVVYATRAAPATGEVMDLRPQLQAQNEQRQEQPAAQNGADPRKACDAFVKELGWKAPFKPRFAEALGEPIEAELKTLPPAFWAEMEPILNLATRNKRRAFAVWGELCRLDADLSVNDRDLRIATFGEMAGRSINSTSEIEAPEWGLVADRLQTLLDQRQGQTPADTAPVVEAELVPEYDPFQDE